MINVTSSRLLLASALALCAQANACHAAGDDAGDDAETARAAGESLTLEENAADHAAGRLAAGGAAIAFDLRQAGDARHLVLRASDGRELLDSTLRGRVDESSVLGGRLRVSGDVRQLEPRVEGDAGAFDALRALPEYPLTVRLRDALVEGGVSRDLVEGRDADGAPPGVEPAGAGVFNTWYTLYAAETMDFPSWSFWGVTNVQIHNDSPIDVPISFRAGAGYELNWVAAYRHARYGRQWAAFRAFITNEAYDPQGVISIYVN